MIETAARDETKAAALLEQTKWICNDLALRCESCNQRAGIYMGLALGICTLGFPMALPNVEGAFEWTATLAVLAGLVATAFLCFRVLQVRSGHGVGLATISGLVSGKIDIPEGMGIHACLLDSLAVPPDGHPRSAADGLQANAKDKAALLEWAQWLFFASGLVAVSASLVAAFMRA